MENPYIQYFTDEKLFQKRPPMSNPIGMTIFRKRIGAEKIFKISLMVNLLKKHIITIEGEYELI